MEAWTVDRAPTEDMNNNKQGTTAKSRGEEGKEGRKETREGGREGGREGREGGGGGMQGTDWNRGKRGLREAVAYRGGVLKAGEKKKQVVAHPCKT